MKIDLDTLKLKCLRCGYRWIPRKPEVHMCPRCKSLLWNKPKDKE